MKAKRILSLFSKFLKTLFFCIFYISCSQQVNANEASDVSENTITPDRPNLFYSDKGQSLFGYYLRALHADANKDTLSAAKFYTESLAIDNTNPELLQASFINLYATGQIIAAAEIAQQAESLNLNLQMGIEPALVIAAKDADWEAVLALSESAMIEGSSQHLGFLFRAWAMYNLEQNSAAISIFKMLSKLLEEQGYKDHKFIDLFIAQLFILEKNSSMALEQLSKISLNKSSNQELIIATAQTYALAGELIFAKKLAYNLSENYNREKVLFWLEQMSETDIPEEQRGYFLAQSIVHLSLFTLTDESMSYLRHRSQLGLFLAESYDFDLPAANFILLQLADKQNNFKDTSLHFNSIPETNPRFQNSLMLYLYQLKQYDETADAIKKLQAYILRGNSNIILTEMLADFYRIEKQYYDAIKTYENVARKKPNLADVYRKLGICYEQTNQPKLAESAFEKALKLNPNDSNTLNHLGYWWADEGRNLSKAAELITRAVELYPDNGYYADSLGWVYFKIGEIEKSVLWLERAVQLAPDDAVIHEHLGDVYWHLGRPLEARYKWQLAHEMHSDKKIRELVSEKIKFGLFPKEH